MEPSIPSHEPMKPAKWPLRAGHFRESGFAVCAPRLSIGGFVMGGLWGAVEVRVLLRELGPGCADEV